MHIKIYALILDLCIKHIQNNEGELFFVQAHVGLKLRNTRIINK